MTNTTHAIQSAQAALHRRISATATRRFVAKAQGALPRDGTVVQGNARKLVAKFAKCVRKQGRTTAGETEVACDARAPAKACRQKKSARRSPRKLQPVQT